VPATAARPSRRLGIVGLLVLALVGLQVPPALAAPTIVDAPPVNAVNVATYVVTATVEITTATADLSIDDADLATPAETATAAVDPGDTTAPYSVTFPAVDLSALSDGSLSVTVTSSDDPAAPTTVTVLKDTVVPAAPAVDPLPATVNAAGRTAVAVSGTAETGTVTVTADDADPATTPETATAPASGGTFSATLDLTGLQDGVITVAATVQDAAGNVSPASTPQQTTLDTAAPGAPVVAAPPLQVNGPFTVSGTAEALATVDVTVDDDGAPGVETATATADAGGAWSTTVDPVGLRDGTLLITATATDAAGNTSPASAPQSTTLDTDPPGAPTIAALPTTVNAAEQASVPVAGTAETGTTVTVTADDADPGTAPESATVTAADGSWATILDLSGLDEGTVTVTATATDPAANTSATSPGAPTLLDRTAPAVTLVQPETVTATDGGELFVSGSAEVGARIDVVVDDGNPATPAETATAIATPAYGLTIDVSGLSDGLLDVDVTASDAAGNTTVAGAAVLADRSPPAVTVDDPAVLRTGDLVTITGTVEAGAEVRVLVDLPGLPDVAETATVSGTDFSATVDVGATADATLTVTVEATDAVGNLGTAGTTILVDRTGPVVGISAGPDAIEGATPAGFTATRVDNNLAETLTVRITVAGALDELAAPLPAEVVIPAGATSATVTAPLIDDDVYERPETVTATVAADAAYTVALDAASATVQIVDDQPAPAVSITVTPASLTEDADGTATFTLSRETTTAGTIAVAYQRGGGADNPDDALGDFTTPFDLVASGEAGVLLLGETQTALTFVVDPVQDSLVEADDVLELTLLEGEGYSLDAASSARLTIVNDDVAPEPDPTEAPSPDPTEEPSPDPTEEPSPDPTDTPAVVVDVTPNAQGEAEIAAELPEGTLRLDLTGVTGSGTITVDRETGQPEDAPQGVALLPVYYEFEQSPGLDFDEVTVTLPYDEGQLAAAGIAEGDLAGIHILDDGSVEDFTARVDTAADEVSGTVTEFSAFALGSYNLERLAGENRYETAARVSAATFAPDVEVAYVATGEAFPDALAGGPAAGLQDAPILLVGADVPAATAAELARLSPDRIVVLGGEVAVSTEVETALATYADSGVSRLAGADRFATAAAISAEVFDPGVDTVYVATGANFPDALAGAAAAGREGAPLLLVGTDIAAPTAAELARLDPDRIVVLGGEVAVPAQVEAALAQTAPVERLAGDDRYATAAAVAASFAQPGGSVYLATGGNFPDALTGAPAAIQDGAPVLLVDTTAVPGPTGARLEALDPTQIVVLGGTAAVSADVEVQARPALLE